MNQSARTRENQRQVGQELSALPKSAPAAGGSYLEQFQRMKKRTEYKTYTVDDYRKLQKEINLNLGTLGPDMANESLRERVCIYLIQLIHL